MTGTVLVNVEMDSYVRGKRSKKKFSKKFKIRNELWKFLCNFADQDELCSRGKWNKDTLFLVKTQNLQNSLANKVYSVSELEFYADFRKEYFGANVIVEKTFVDYTFSRSVERVDSFGFAYLFTKTNDRIMKVKISDQLRNKVEVGDLVEVSVLQNQRMIITDVLDQDDVDLDERRTLFNDLQGEY